MKVRWEPESRCLEQMFTNAQLFALGVFLLLPCGIGFDYIFESAVRKQSVDHSIFKWG